MKNEYFSSPVFFFFHNSKHDFFFQSSKHEKYCFYEEDLKHGVFGPIEQFLHLLCFLDKI
jgi:hypothetical protein